jgi:hypothetical protein
MGPAKTNPQMKAATEKHVRAATPFRARATRSSARREPPPVHSRATIDRFPLTTFPFLVRFCSRAQWNTLLAAMTPVEIPAENLSAEELAEFEARAKAYSKKKMAQHRAWQKDITDKIRHKRAAVAALPEGYLRTAAEQEDHALFPLKRQTPMMTPPIEGFYEEKQRKAEEAVSGEGRMGGGGRR